MPFSISLEFLPVLLATVLAGLLFGSFLNVCIARLPRHVSIVAPRSSCPVCGGQIRALDNIPIASWLWLRRRCRQCRASISIQYPLVELGTAILFIACLIQTGLRWETLIHAVACFFLLGLAVMDAQTMILPDTFTLTGLAIAFVLKVCEPGIGLGLGTEFDPALEQRAHVALRTFEDAALAAGMLLLVWAAYWIVRRRHGVGMGDIKLLAMMGAFLGLPLTILAYFVGVMAAAVFALVLITQRKAGSFDRIPFGTFLAAAGIFAIFAGKQILTKYLALFQ